ncbi:MAG: aspartate/glutamate racemase family protein [Devosia sp.]|uniref:aspartate racemase/maleate isomerase family protein n=1 Tax=Devosia sp. TaxID=1871048 RepID=UPI0024C6DEFD|nr:ectoine utilization protein EutA [Devosia sp.]UYN98603.1 MAG: aspartate/glutamate racemase family protein [Devosia sp.]
MTSGTEITQTSRPQLDGERDHARFGLIALATDLTTEGDFRRMMPAKTAVHTSRIPFENPTTPENLRRIAPHLTEAAALLVPGVPLGAICFSCTSASATIGDDTVTGAIQSGRPGVPVVTPTGAALLAMSALNVARIAILTPYIKSTSEQVAGYFEARGLSVSRLSCFGLEDDREMARVSHRSIVEGALALDSTDAEALFLSCTALPAVGVVAEIEKLTGKPVITSNQASLWAMMRLGGRASYRPRKWGRLFSLDLPAIPAGGAA